MAKSDSAGFGLKQRKPGGNWHFEFQINRIKHRGSTGKKSHREAVKFARAKHAELSGTAPVVSTARRKDRITLDEAFARYFEEKGQYLADADDLLVRLDRIAERLGRHRFLDEITFPDLHNYVQKRRRDGVANRTVNADVPESMRRVAKWAVKWGVDTGEVGQAGFLWKDLRLELPKHRDRFLSRSEKAQLLWAIRKDYRRLLVFAMLTGMRLSALMVHKDDVLWDVGLIRYKAKSRIENDTKFVPITSRVSRLLRYCFTEDPNGEWVFTYCAQRSKPAFDIVAGDRVPVNPRGFERAMTDAVKKVGLPNWRLIHDLRHTAATDAMRASQHPVAVQKMLGHSTIEQTMKYAHVLHDDVRMAMEKMSAVHTKPTQNRGAQEGSEKKLRKISV